MWNDGRPYRDLTQARASIGRFIEEIYNRQRLHSALDYLAPIAFEAVQVAKPRWRMRPSQPQ